MQMTPLVMRSRSKGSCLGSRTGLAGGSAGDLGPCLGHEWGTLDEPEEEEDELDGSGWVQKRSPPWGLGLGLDDPPPAAVTGPVPAPTPWMHPPRPPVAGSLGFDPRGGGCMAPSPC